MTKFCLIIVSLFLMVSPALSQERWGIITVCCAHLRAKPTHVSEMVSEALMGTPVKVGKEENGWYYVETPDHYFSWVHPASLRLLSEEEWLQWRYSARYIYTAYQGFIYEQPHKEALPVSDVVTGCIVSATGKTEKGYFPVSLPDGRKGYIKKQEAEDFYEWACRVPDLDTMLSTGKQMMGTTYLWGGTSVKGADCSGFTRIVYFSGGILLERDASQQAENGEWLTAEGWGDCRAGDLLFFGTGEGKINHVGIYLKDGTFLHSSGRVKINSLDKTSESYLPLNWIATRRILTRVGSKGIRSVKNHDWYFPVNDSYTKSLHKR